ncbi:septation ring formation regulator EzrA [Sporolactobacillus sp. THM7-4]|nr:septation ring formation regulator EzrA [Sporolactobacillus sp. THM7-4]
MLFVIIGMILLFIAAVIYGAWRRKKTYSEIDRIEAWRVELTNRPIAKEMAKIKELKMVGETEKKFDKWRNDWDSILTGVLPSVEETLFTAEELTDKYQFRKAEQLIKSLNIRMEKTEDRINRMLNDLNAVVDSASKNREDVTPIKESYHQIKKNMITKRSQFRKALPLLEQQVKDIDRQFKKYDTETETGKYIEARETLLQVKKAIESVGQQIERVPGLYQDIQRTIPDQLRELREGHQEMSEQGYSLEYLQVDAQVDEMEKHLHVLLEAVAKLELDDTEESLKEMHEQLDFLYAQMEKEVLSRQQLHEIIPVVEDKLDKVGDMVRALDDETETVRESYHIDVDDLKAQREIDKAYQKLEKSFFEADEILKKHSEAFSSILEKLESMKNDIIAVEAAADEFSDKIKALRKDEMAAKETIQKLKRSLFETKRMIQKSNIPGVPAEFADALVQAGDGLKAVNEKLDEKPLDMSSVQELLTHAGTFIKDVHSRAETMVETAEMAEEMIRYGNRYRSEYPDIDQELKKAEISFRNYDYHEALETAVKAIEKKEPKILKKVDLYQGRRA